MTKTPTLKECRERLEEARQMTKGKLPMVMVCKTKDELDNLKTAAKGMRGIKNLTMRLDK
jgi:hypothetical protein